MHFQMPQPIGQLEGYNPHAHSVLPTHLEGKRVISTWTDGFSMFVLWSLMSSKEAKRHISFSNRTGTVKG